VVVSYGPRRFGSRMPAVPEVVESKEPWARLNSNANQQDADDPEVGPGQYGWKCAPHQHKRNGIHRGIRSVLQPNTLRGTDLPRNRLPQAVAPRASESTTCRGPFIQIPPPLSRRRWQKSLGSYRTARQRSVAGLLWRSGLTCHRQQRAYLALRTGRAIEATSRTF